jgi:hypothetical protein
MLNRRRELAEQAAAQLAARRRREDEAPRLSDAIPSLAALSLRLAERRGEAPVGSSHIRRVVLAHAPALFVLPCCAPGCDGGEHDLTHVVLAALRRGSSRFEGATPCDRCACVIEHAGEASYHGPTG